MWRRTIGIRDQIFLALRALQRSIKLAAGLKIDRRPFYADDQEEKQPKVEANNVALVDGQEVGATRDEEEPRAQGEPSTEELEPQRRKGLKRSEMHALLPVLAALQSQIKNACRI